jgi:signal transduction histidine kinase/CheY-like chemotaxis protein
MPAVRSARKISASHSLYLQLLFVTLAFTLMVITSGVFVKNMLVNYLKRDALNILLQTQIRIVDELREPETLMIPIAKDVHDIIVAGGGAGDVREYFDEISAELYKKEGGFIFDGLHGYFDVFGGIYIPVPGWIVPDDYDATARPWYKAAVEADGKITASSIYLSFRSHEFQINVACRIFGSEGEPLGVISMNIALDNIMEFVADMHLVEGGYGFLANENFILAAHHEADFISRHMNEIGPGFRKIVELMEKGERFVKVEGKNYQSIKSIFYCERIENGWYLGIMTPRNVYYRDLTILILFLCVLGFVLVLAVSIILVRIDAGRNKLDEVFKDSLNKRLKQQSLMTYISQSFLSAEDVDTLITKVLRMVGEFMSVDQILMHVTKDNGTSFTCNNEWINPKLGLPTRVGGTFTIGESVLHIIRKAKEHQVFYVTSDDPEVRKAVGPYRVNFRNFITTAVFLGDDLYAVIDFSREGNDSWWNQDEISMASFMTNALIGALTKRMAELQLIAAKEEAEQSSHSKGIFLAHMSHEIRTPMNAILGISEIQLQGKALSPDAEEAFKHIYDSGSLLLNIINDILDFSKIEAGKLEIVPVKYDVPSLLNDAAQLNRLRYESKPIKFKLDLDQNTPMKLYGDELRIKQILNNLLSNAFKYTEHGEIELSVFAEQGKDEETVMLVFRVSDTGQGMREDQVERVFDEYVRFNMQTNRGISGSGLGMAIVKRIIDMMDGEIFVESEAEKGTTFTVRLPQKNTGSDVCGAEIADSLRNFRFQSTPLSKKTQIVHEYMPYGSVLVVDDVASNLYVARGLLAPYGLRVETAASGIEAVEKIKSGGVYDIVFMDHMMPVMDGIEAANVLRGIGYTRPVIALTANAVVGQSEIFLANGFGGFISKPIDSRELDTILNRFIRDKQPQELIEAARRRQREIEIENSGKPAKDKEYTSEIEKYFVLDAVNAIKVIEETYKNAFEAATVERYITAVHGIKNVLANIGEIELSAVALRLEKAGNERDHAVIMGETPAFVDALRFLVDKYKPAVNDEITEIPDSEQAFLRDKLLTIKTACDAFDKTAAKDALNDLRRKAWPRRINECMDEISAHLLHSAFKKASAAAENAVKM